MSILKLSPGQSGRSDLDVLHPDPFGGFRIITGPTGGGRGGGAVAKPTVSNCSDVSMEEKKQSNVVIPSSLRRPWLTGSRGIVWVRRAQINNSTEKSTTDQIFLNITTK